MSFKALFECLDQLESRLESSRYLCGEQITEADWRLFTTLIRFDAVYYTHFKTNLRRISDYPELHAYTSEIYQQPGIGKTVNFEHIKEHYFFSHETINPQRIAPQGPELDFNSTFSRKASAV